MTQQQYLQWMANICGETPGSTTQDLINWARGKGMNPAGGWQLNAKLSKDVVAQTLVQLLNLAPRKGTFDAVQILQREGIILTSDSDGKVTVKDMAGLTGSLSPQFESPFRDGNPPSETRPGYGKGDKNHEHTGPPGLANKPGNGGSNIGSKGGH